MQTLVDLWVLLKIWVRLDRFRSIQDHLYAISSHILLTLDIPELFNLMDGDPL